MQHFEELFPPLIGLHGVGDPAARIERGDLQPALVRLADARPGQLLLATDFDGTLAPITPHPDAASAVRAGLRRFAVVLPTSGLAAANLTDREEAFRSSGLEVAYFATVEEATGWLVL